MCVAVERTLKLITFLTLTIAKPSFLNLSAKSEASVLAWFYSVQTAPYTPYQDRGLHHHKEEIPNWKAQLRHPGEAEPTGLWCKAYVSILVIVCEWSILEALANLYCWNGWQSEAEAKSFS